jgi:hypothetical protein
MNTQNHDNALEILFGVKPKLTKKEICEDFINDNFKMPTSEIIKRIKEEQNIDVSERHIQRVRKEIKKKRHNTFHKGNKQRSINGGDDKYYTKQYIANYYSHIVYEKYGDLYDYVEPTAGNGAFLNVIPNITGYDLKPERDNVIEMDVFKNTFNENNIIIGNPPFGLSGNLAIKIFNHITKFNVKAICFILPRSFKKDSTKNKLDLNYSLVFEQDLIKNSFTVDDKQYNVPCVFQIWEKSKPRKIVQPDPYIWFEFTNKENADIAVRRAGSKAGQLLEGLDHKAVSTYFLKIKSHLVVKAIKLIDRSVCDNTAGVRSISKNELNSQINKIMSVLTTH